MTDSLDVGKFVPNRRVIHDAAGRQLAHDGAIAQRRGNQIDHGGPIAEPDDVQYVLSRTNGICGFFGASSIERLPTERAITEQVRNFKNLNIHTN